MQQAQGGHPGFHIPRAGLHQLDADGARTHIDPAQLDRLTLTQAGHPDHQGRRNLQLAADGEQVGVLLQAGPPVGLETAAFAKDRIDPGASQDLEPEIPLHAQSQATAQKRTGPGLTTYAGEGQQRHALGWLGPKLPRPATKQPRQAQPAPGRFQSFHA